MLIAVSDASRPQESTGDSKDSSAFSLLGSEGEVVSNKVAAPAKHAASDGIPLDNAAHAMASVLLLAEAMIGASGKADVVCAVGACHIV